MAMALEEEGTLVSMVRSALGRASREMTDEIARRCGCSSSTKGKKEQHLLSMMTPPLSSMVMAEQIHNNMWERNGRGVMRGESVRAAAAFRVCSVCFLILILIPILILIF